LKDLSSKAEAVALMVCLTGPVVRSPRTPISPVWLRSLRWLSKRPMLRSPALSVVVVVVRTLNSLPLRAPKAAQATAFGARSTSPRTVPKVSRSFERVQGWAKLWLASGAAGTARPAPTVTLGRAFSRTCSWKPTSADRR
jgi:hypothetical protein